MENITNFTDYMVNEATVEIEGTEEGVYVLSLQEIKNIINSFTDIEIDDEAIIEELEDYIFVKVEDTELTKVDDVEDDNIEPGDFLTTGELDELSSDDENPTFIKKFEIHSDEDMKRGEEDKKSKFGIDIKFENDFRKEALVKKKLVRLKSQISDDKLKKQIDIILDLIEK